LTQLKKKLDHQVYKEKQDRIQKTSHNHQSVLRARKFAFDRELKDQTGRISSEIEQWKEQIASDLDKLGPNTKSILINNLENNLKNKFLGHELNIQKFSDAFTFANTCFRLESALTTDPFPQLDWQHQVQPIKHYLKQLVQTSEEHRSFVDKVIASIPAKVTIRGVFTENALKQRFKEVESMARKTSFLKSNDNNSLSMYILSLVRSMLLVRPVGCISKRERDNEPVDLSKLTNEELLDRAK